MRNFNSYQSYHCVHTHIQTGSTALYAAAENGHLEIVNMLIDANADVNIKANVSHNKHSYTDIGIFMIYQYGL